MKKFSFSSEILTLFFIITIAVSVGKVLVDVKNIFADAIKGDEKTGVEIIHNAYTYYEKNACIETIKDLTVIRNMDELKHFQELLTKVNVNIEWLNSKLANYNEEYFEKKVLIVISIVNDNNINITKINDVSKENDEITIELVRKVDNTKPTKKYTLFTIVEIEDRDSEYKLNLVREKAY